MRRSPARSARPRSGAVYVAFEPAPERLLEPLGDTHECVQVDARLDAFALQQIDEVFRGDVPRGLRRVRTSTKSSHRGIEHRGACVERGEGVRVTAVARVVEMHAYVSSLD